MNDSSQSINQNWVQLPFQIKYQRLKSFPITSRFTRARHQFKNESFNLIKMFEDKKAKVILTI